MKRSTNEVLLALRAPNAGWLAALICALEEALRDPDFGETQRQLIGDLLAEGSVPPAVAAAANERLLRFEQTVQDLHTWFNQPLEDFAPTATARPKLTICGGAA